MTYVLSYRNRQVLVFMGCSKSRECHAQMCKLQLYICVTILKITEIFYIYICIEQTISKQNYQKVTKSKMSFLNYTSKVMYPLVLTFKQFCDT